MDSPPVYYYHPGTEKWRYADQWPLPGVVNGNYYLHGDGVLNTNAPSGEEPSVSYVYDPKNPVQTIGGRNLSLPRGPRDQTPVEPPNRKDVLVYKSEVLAKDVEIAGTVKVILHASSTCKDTDFHAKLVDVHPDGKTMLVLDGVIRALYRESPKNPVPMEPGKVYEFTIVLGDINHVFKTGNRIQVDISSSNFPRRVRNTNSGNPLFAADTEKDIVVATNTIHHASKYPSQIVLPVLPPQKPNVFEGTANFETAGVTYKGPADLYVFPTATYLNFRDQWIKWKTIRNWQDGSEEHYESEGKVGKVSVVLQPKDQRPFDIFATGEGAYFKGWKK
jgi:putative CocE/NonD family hydrolase